MSQALLTSAVRAVVPRAARNWLRDPRGTCQWGIDHARFALGRVESVEMRPGWTVKAHPLAARCAYATPLADPEQRAELDSFLNACEPGMRLLDIGAHFGVFAFAALHYGGTTSSVVAVDPSRVAVKMLRVQAELNAVAHRLKVVEACAGSLDGHRGMLDTGVIGAGYFVAADEGRRAADLSDVRAVSVDTLCRELDFCPTHVKIDVEGEELDVLRGAVGVLRRTYQPRLFLELHNEILRSRRQNPTAVVGWLADEGYVCRDVSSGPIGPATFARPVSRLVATPACALA